MSPSTEGGGFHLIPEAIERGLCATFNYAYCQWWSCLETGNRSHLLGILPDLKLLCLFLSYSILWKADVPTVINLIHCWVNNREQQATYYSYTLLHRILYDSLVVNFHPSICSVCTVCMIYSLFCQLQQLHLSFFFLLLHCEMLMLSYRNIFVCLGMLWLPIWLCWIKYTSSTTLPMWFICTTDSTISSTVMLNRILM